MRRLRRLNTEFIVVAALLVTGMTGVIIGLLPTHVTHHLPMQFHGSTMGTTWKVRYGYNPTLGEPIPLETDVQSRLDVLEHTFSTWRSDSEISRFNAARTTDWFPVSHELARVVAESQRISEQTGGAFDATVLPLVKLWGFVGPDRKDVIPPDSAIMNAMAHVGYQHLHVRLDPPALRKDDPQLAIDLSGIAKGHAVDAVDAYLAGQHIEHDMIEIGGELKVRGHDMRGPWRLGIELPDDHIIGAVMQPLQLTGIAMATSGDYRNDFIVDGRRYSHEIDPHTGRPTTHHLASVTVLHDSCMTADALATALMVMGETDGQKFAVDHDLAVLFVIRDGDNLHIVRSPAWAKTVQQHSTSAID